MGSVGYLSVFVAQFKPVMDYTGYIHLINKELTPNPWIPVFGIMLDYAIGEGVQQFQDELKNTNATLPQLNSNRTQ